MEEKSWKNYLSKVNVLKMETWSNFLQRKRIIQIEHGHDINYTFLLVELPANEAIDS